jgi:hypothetical protein
MSRSEKTSRAEKTGFSRRRNSDKEKQVREDCTLILSLFA